jgi:hypothetical protein
MAICERGSGHHTNGSGSSRSLRNSSTQEKKDKFQSTRRSTGSPTLLDWILISDQVKKRRIKSSQFTVVENSKEKKIFCSFWGKRTIILSDREVLEENFEQIDLTNSCFSFKFRSVSLETETIVLTHKRGKIRLVGSSQVEVQEWFECLDKALMRFLSKKYSKYIIQTPDLGSKSPLLGWFPMPSIVCFSCLYLCCCCWICGLGQNFKGCCGMYRLCRPKNWWYQASIERFSWK